MSKDHASISIIWQSWWTRCFLAFPWIFHASELGWGDRPNICQKYNWDFVITDYPYEGFSMDHFINDVVKFLEKIKYKEIIICWFSFGEIVCRELMIRCSQDIKKNIVHHISLCGASTFTQLSSTKKRVIKLSSMISSKPIIGLLKWCLSLASYIENHGICGLWKHFVGRQNYVKHTWISHDRENSVIIAGSRWLNPGIFERWCVVANTHSIGEIDVDTTAIYAAHDWFFKDAKHTAETILSYCIKTTKLIEAKPWGHGSLVEFPETYNPILENILERVEKANH